MAVKLRLKRMGSKAKPFYRIVAADSRSPRDGKLLETVGTYDPIKGNDKITLDEERIIYWLGVGAQPTDTVRSIFSKQGLMKKFQESKKNKPVIKKADEKKVEVEVKVEKKTTTKKTTATKTTTKKEPAKKSTTTKKATTKKATTAKKTTAKKETK